jgi:hypothetical protein
MGFSNKKKRENKLGMSYLDVGKESEPYDLFTFVINPEQTREKYISRMKKFLEIIGIDQEKKLTEAFSTWFCPVMLHIISFF